MKNLLSTDNRLPISLFLLRIGVFIVMFMWTLDKFVRPEHASAVYEQFYYISGIGSHVMYTLAALELLLIIAFVVGYKKKFTYGLVLIFHAVSTFSSLGAYFTPFQGPHLLFFAAWPMLAACITLFLLRDQDTLWTVNK